MDSHGIFEISGLYWLKMHPPFQGLFYTENPDWHKRSLRILGWKRIKFDDLIFSPEWFLLHYHQVCPQVWYLIRKQKWLAPHCFWSRFRRSKFIVSRTPLLRLLLLYATDAYSIDKHWCNLILWLFIDASNWWRWRESKLNTYKTLKFRDLRK